MEHARAATFCPPVNGDYEFRISAGNGQVRLWLGSDEDPTDRVIAGQISVTRNRSGFGAPADVNVSRQESGPIPLEAGQRYYIETVHKYSSGEERLAKHHIDLMDIWLAVREWIETRYEDVVANLENEGRRVTGFLGLAWPDEQRRFYECSRTKTLYSPTYRDVAQPVYSRSVGRWRAYEKHLAPIVPVLELYCQKLRCE